MKRLRQVVFVYSLVAAFLLLAACICLGFQLTRQRAVLRAQSARLANLSRVCEAVELKYRAMEQQQREARAGYNPRQAIEMSIRVQDAKDVFISAESDCHAEAQDYSAAERTYARRSLWLVPLIAVFLLHLVVASAFLPQRDASRTAGRLDRAGPGGG
jgi:hypothetical protein